MQRKTFFVQALALTATVAVLFSACDNFALPTGIAVKTDAEYNVALGEFSYDLSTASDGKSLDSTLTSSLGENAKYYNYVTGSDAPLTYLLQYPLYDVPLDINQYFESFDLGKNVGENISMDFDIALPDGNIDAGGAEFSAAQVLGSNTDISGNGNITTDSETSSEQTFNGKADLSNMDGKGIQKFSFTDAKITIEIPRPEGWSTNITAEIDNFTMGSDTPTKESSNTSDTLILKQVYNWAATDLTPSSEINSSGKIKFKVPNGATINNNKVKVNVNVQITTLSSVTVDLKSLNENKSIGYTLPTDGSDGSVEMSNEMLKYVRKIAFLGTEDTNASFGIKANTVNTMPQGNEITVNLTAFKELSTDKSESGYFTTTGKIESNSTEAGKEANWTGNGFTVTLPDASENENDKKYLDFVLEIADEQTFKDLTMGESYKLAVSDVQMVNNFSSVTANLSDQSQDIDQDMSEFNLNEMLTNATSGLGVEGLDSMKIEELEVYFFAQKPSLDSLSSVTMKGDMHLVYNENTTGLDLLESSGGNFYFVDAVAWPKTNGETVNANDEAAVKTFAQATESGKAGKYYSFKTDLAETLNSNPTGLRMKGNINMGDGSSASDIKITKEELDNAQKNGGTTQITLEMAIVLPFKFSVENPVKFTALKASEDNADLLGRADASTYAEFTDYLGAIDYVKMSYSMDNSLLKDLGITLSIEDKGNTGFSSSNSVSSGKGSIKLTASDMEKVFTRYPFNPEINLVIGEGATSENPKTISLKSGTMSQQLKIGMDFSIKMDGDTPITVWGGKAQ